MVEAEFGFIFIVQVLVFVKTLKVDGPFTDDAGSKLDADEEKRIENRPI